MITVVTLADHAYAMPLAVMVRSLLDNLGPRALRLIVVDGGISDSDKEKLKASWQTSAAWPRVQAEFHRAWYGELDTLPTWGRMSVLTYSRIGLGRYVPSDCRRAVLLDSDTMVLTDVGRLADEPLGHSVLAAPRDPFIPTASSPGGLHNCRDFGLAADAPYFNAGVMTVDLERWRDQRVEERAFDFVRQHGRDLNNFDQDALNFCLAGQWKELDRRWQVHPRARNSLNRAPCSHQGIVHFSGRLKPWAYRASGDADAQFFKYLDRTEWNGWRPPLTARAIALRCYDTPVRRWFYPAERWLLFRGSGLLRRLVA